jgi:methionyl aminopeptidase
MIIIKSENEIKLMRHAGEVLVSMLDYLKPFIKEGITPKEIDKLGFDFITSHDCVPTCLGFEGYPASLCISVNDVVVHGIPDSCKLKDGDIVTIDVVVGYHGYQADAAYTYAVGKISDDKKYLLEHTKKALFEGLAQVKPGNRIGDISNAVEQYANRHHLGVVRELCGHGIGSDMHEDPDVPNFGKPGVGPKLKPGMVICIEPMLTFGSREIYLMDDDWTVKTCDRSPAAHFEYTILVTDDGYEVLTPWKD